MRTSTPRRAARTNASCSELPSIRYGVKKPRRALRLGQKLDIQLVAGGLAAQRRIIVREDIPVRLRRGGAGRGGGCGCGSPEKAFQNSVNIRVWFWTAGPRSSRPKSFQWPNFSTRLIYSSARLMPPVESDLAVDNHHFAVVAAVERALQKQKRVKRRAADALLLQPPGVAAVVGRNAAKVVVQNADVDARGGLAAQKSRQTNPTKRRGR